MGSLLPVPAHVTTKASSLPCKWPSEIRFCCQNTVASRSSWRSRSTPCSGKETSLPRSRSESGLISSLHSGRISYDSSHFVTFAPHPLQRSGSLPDEPLPRVTFSALLYEVTNIWIICYLYE